MAKRKILFINQEITPYVPETEMSIMGKALPQAMQEKGHEIGDRRLGVEEIVEGVEDVAQHEDNRKDQHQHAELDHEFAEDVAVQRRQRQRLRLRHVGARDDLRVLRGASDPLRFGGS